MTADNNPSPVPGGAGTTPAGGKDNVNPSASGQDNGNNSNGAQPNPHGLTLEGINQATGRNYGTLDDALKGIGETFKFVGNPGARQPGGANDGGGNPTQPLPAGFVSRDEFELSNWYRDNPDHAANRELIDTFAKAHGMKPQDVVNSDNFKKYAEKLKVADEVGSARSSLTSNPRLGIVRDSATKAAQAIENASKARASGDVVAADRFQREAESSAVKAVIDGFGLQNDRIVD